MARPRNAVSAAGQEIGRPQDWNIPFTGGELLETLSGRAMMLEMAKMAATDETVGSMLWCISSTLAQVTWKHEPQIDGAKATKDPEALKWAALADTLLVDMDHSFGDHVDDATQMVWAGFSLCEMVTKQRISGQSRFTDGYYGFKRLSNRDPTTIWSWLYDPTNRDVIGAQQQTWRGSAILPMWKTLHYRPTSNPEAPMGKSLLRSAHRPWRLKNRIQDSEAIGIERELAGLPIARIPEEILEIANRGGEAPTADALNARSKINTMIKAATDMRFNKSGGLVLPSDTYGSENDTNDRTPKYDLDILTTAGQRSIDARTAARDYDRAIARVVMMQFLHLGDRSTGSYGLSDDQSSMAVRSMMSFTIKIGEEWDRKGLGLIWSLNGFPDKYRPALKASVISKDGIANIGAFMSGIARSAGLWDTDSKTRMAILQAAGFEYDVDAQTAAAARAVKKAEMEAVKPPTAPFGGDVSKSLEGENDENP